MKMRRLGLALLGAAALSGRAAGQQNFEKTIPVPRTGVAKLDWSLNKCTIESVELRNYPDGEDIEKARSEDPKDHSWVWWEFNLENRGDTKCKIRLWVEVLDKDGKVIKSSDRSGSVDAHKVDDEIRVSTRMRTLDIADAPKAHLRATIDTK